MADEKLWHEQVINTQDKSKKVTIEIRYSHEYCQFEKLKVGDNLNGGVITAIN